MTSQLERLPVALLAPTANPYELAREYGYYVSRKQVWVKGVRTVWPFLMSAAGHRVARLTHEHTPKGISYRWRPL